MVYLWTHETRVTHAQQHTRQREQTTSHIVAANTSEAIYDNDLEFASDDTL